MVERNNNLDPERMPRKNAPRLSHAFGRKKSHEPGDETPWLKRNANVLVLIGGGVVSLGLFLVLGMQLGWWFTGEGRAKPTRPVAKRPSSVKPTPPPAQPTPQPKKAKPVKTTPVPSVGQGTHVVIDPSRPSPAPRPAKPEKKAVEESPKEEKPEEPPLSDDVSKWQKADYFRARQENHAKLLEAVSYLGETFVGSEPAAGGLTELLEPLPKEKTATGTASRPTQSQMTKLVEAVIEALGRNGTSSARDTLEQVLSGKFATDDDKAAVEAAVKTLAVHPSKENDTLLFRVLSDAEKLRPTDREGPWPAEELQKKALEWVEEDASAGLRTQLAQWLVGHVRSLDLQEPMCKFLMEPDPRNLGAQIFFYTKADTPNEVKITAEVCFLDDGKEALAHYLGIPEEFSGKLDSKNGTAGNGAKDDAKDEKIEADPSPQIVAKLWSPAFRELLKPQLNAGVLERQTQLLSLAATIPDESFRSDLNNMIRKCWTEGPAMFKRAHLTEQVIDPGLLVAVKLGGYRRESSSVPQLPPVGPSKSGNQNRLGLSAPRSADIVRKHKAEQAWMDYSAELVDSLRKRFAAAADATAGSDPKPKLPEGFKLSENAEVKAAHHVLWPADAPPELVELNLGPLEVYYVRTEESNQVKRLTGFYSRELKLRMSDLRLYDKMIWMDSQRMKTRKGWRRSVDLLITRTTGGSESPVANNDEADFIVEILVIEIKDPTKN